MADGPDWEGVEELLEKFRRRWLAMIADAGLRDRPEDILQEVTCRLWVNPKRCGERGWVYRAIEQTLKGVIRGLQRRHGEFNGPTGESSGGNRGLQRRHGEFNGRAGEPKNPSPEAGFTPGGTPGLHRGLRPPEATLAPASPGLRA